MGTKKDYKQIRPNVRSWTYPNYFKRLEAAWKKYMKTHDIRILLKDFEMGVDFGDPDYYEDFPED
tara:strand:- start:269 stop:463 length:195 start_codon:yes stop_codon:yes gene_type:complete